MTFSADSKIPPTTIAIVFSFFLLLLLPHSSSAQMEELDNLEMDQIVGASGVAIGFHDQQQFLHIEKFHYCATDNGYLTFNHLTLHDANSTLYKLNFDFGTTMTNNGIMYFDIGTLEVATQEDFLLSSTPVSDYRSLTGLRVPNWDQNYIISIYGFTFSDGTAANTFNLGQLDFGPYHLNKYNYWTSPHMDGTGLDFMYEFQSHFENIAWAYQMNSSFTSCERLNFKNFYFGESFADYAGDNPANPATWKTNNNVDYGMFKIGDLFGDLTPGSERHSNPAQFDVGMVDDPVAGDAYLTTLIALPMSGSIRFEQADFGGTDFGPGAIDGITVHRLNLFLTP
jgi:hypothetical protein